MSERLIAALDVPTLQEAESLADRLAGVAGWFKVGLELYTAAGPQAVRAIARRGRVMLDLKLHDIPETVARATARAAELGVGLLTLHVAGGRKMLEAAARARGPELKLLGVTVLTSLDDKDLAEICVEPDVAAVVARRATVAMEADLDGVVASPLEAARVKAAAPAGFLIVTPGIRPAAAGDDQKRVATPAAARAAGATHIVVGRPLRDAADPRAVAEAMARELD
jgi:orotidine-5'-phosphate decarboxylase